MVRKELKVNCPEGLHLRPAGVLAKTASSYRETEITLMYGKYSVNAKSITRILSCGIKCGSVVELCVNGENEEEIMRALTELFVNGFKAGNE